MPLVFICFGAGAAAQAVSAVSASEGRLQMPLVPICFGTSAAALAAGALSVGETLSSAWTTVGSEPA